MSLQNFMAIHVIVVDISVLTKLVDRQADIAIPKNAHKANHNHLENSLTH